MDLTATIEAPHTDSIPATLFTEGAIDSLNSPNYAPGKPRPWTLPDLTSELATRGVLVWQKTSGALSVTPAEAVSDLKAALKQHKEELLKTVPFARSGKAKKVHSRLLGETFWLAADNWVYSPGNKKRPDLFEGMVVYRCEEMDYLLHLHPLLRNLKTPEQRRAVGEGLGSSDPAIVATAKSLRLIHDVKRDMGGTMELIHDAADEIDGTFDEVADLVTDLTPEEPQVDGHTPS